MSSTTPQRSLIPTVGILVIVVCILCGLAYGVIQLQRGEEAYYLRRTASSAKTDQMPAISAKGAQKAIIGDPRHGKDLFNTTCFVCHGPTGAGVPNLGVTLRQSKFVATRTDQQLIAFLKMGRQPGDPHSVRNGTMPPKGGNPFLDDAGLQDVVAFVRLLQLEEHMATPGVAVRDH